jgi:hypothetical protein
MGREGVFPFSPRKIAQDKVKEKLEIRYLYGTVPHPSQPTFQFQSAASHPDPKTDHLDDRLGRLAVTLFSGSCKEGFSLN